MGWDDGMIKVLSLVDIWAGRIRDMKKPEEVAVDPRMDAFGLRI